MTTHIYACLYCKSRNVTPLPGLLDPTCSICTDLLDRVAICACGTDADDIDTESCLSCICDQVRIGEADIDAMSEKLAKRVLAHFRKPVPERVPDLLRRQAA